jgi:hypothetical protein
MSAQDVAAPFTNPKGLSVGGYLSVLVALFLLTPTLILLSRSTSLRRRLAPPPAAVRVLSLIHI